MTGNQTRVKVAKNKMAPPFRQVEFDIMYGEGISKLGELIDIGVQANLVEKSGSWYSYDGQRIGQGRENSKNYFRENVEAAQKLEAQIRANAGLVADQMLVGNADDSDMDADFDAPVTKAASKNQKDVSEAA